jgi:hypothetical protein
MRKGRQTSVVGAAIVALIVGSIVQCEAAENWKYQLTPYLWTAGMSGQIGEAVVDMDFSDILEMAEVGGAVGFEATYKDSWSVMAEGSYFELSVGGAIPEDPAGTTIGIDVGAGAAMLAGMKRVADNVDLYMGARYMYMKTDVNPSLGPTISDTQEWVDPIVGIRVRGEASDKLSVMLDMDVGGFGVSSKLTFHMVANMVYAFNDTYSGVFGYRLLDIEYDRDGFVYDVKQDGLLMGLGISF